ncbi:PHP domain-containing protein [Chryseobacterium sp. JV274]|uniref:PHP domain-containing protein n=1 Tax=unclassified Chryseobacterium TaxID=2593645 RepID=UPI0015D82BDF|nr:PHP domain-containing protein [Chryseobacterium sp. JV274]
MKKGIFHFHSTYSYDGINTLEKIIKIIKEKKLDFVVLTDHDTIKGSLELQKKVKEQNLNVEIPTAAEYKTDRGDVIALNLKNEITDMRWQEFYKNAKEQNALLILPHPYDGHRQIEELAQAVDVIEIFNSRSSVINNYKSYLLALKYKKPVIWSSDSHIPQTLLNVVIGYEKKDLQFHEALTNGEIAPLFLKKSSVLDIFFSQLKKAYVNKDFKLFIYIVYKTLFKRAKEDYLNL